MLWGQRSIQADVSEQDPVIRRRGPAQLVAFLKDDLEVFYGHWRYRDDFAVGREFLASQHKVPVIDPDVHQNIIFGIIQQMHLEGVIVGRNLIVESHLVEEVEAEAGLRAKGGRVARFGTELKAGRALGGPHGGDIVSLHVNERIIRLREVVRLLQLASVEHAENDVVWRVSFERGEDHIRGWIHEDRNRCALCCIDTGGW